MKSISKPGIKRASIVAVISLIVLGLDRYTKILAQEFLKGRVGADYLGGLVRLEYAENKGAFLSLGDQMSDSMRFWVFLVFSGLLVLGVLYYLIKKAMSVQNTLSLSLVLSGGIGNLFDRAFNDGGGVVDFLNMGIGSLRTGIFNVADMAISLGAIVLIIDSFTKENKKSE